MRSADGPRCGQRHFANAATILRCVRELECSCFLPATGLLGLCAAVAAAGARHGGLCSSNLDRRLARVCYLRWLHSTTL